jgi:hypothetical protein
MWPLRAGEIDHRPMLGSGLGARLLDAPDIATAHDDAGAFGGEHPRGGKPDPAGRAGHEAHPIAHPEVDRGSLLGAGTRPRAARNRR